MKPDDARAAMVERLSSEGAVYTSAVARALESVPRHRFVEGVGPEAAYDEVAITVKTNGDGVAISSASQPTIVAAMLELSELEPGHVVLEIGTGTGYNTALLASIVGAEGTVVTVELEDDLGVAARKRLRELDIGHVEFVMGDGAAGHPQRAPYDRIIVTTGAPEIAATWVDQLRDGGRLIVPVVNSGGVGRIRCLVRHGAGLEEITSMPCGFLPMRTP
ncbi:MAG: protein-L-isoaspartate O-methyltransferase [bacterium]|nr:protein-L-isoaspartate O-methyltransferase [bacterium]